MEMGFRIIKGITNKETVFLDSKKLAVQGGGLTANLHPLF